MSDNSSLIASATPLAARMRPTSLDEVVGQSHLLKDGSPLRNLAAKALPGEKSAKVTIQVLGSNAKSFGTVVQQDVVAGRVADIPIAGLADGDYVAIVSANVPIAASMSISRVVGTSKPKIDFALLAAAESSVSERAIRVPTSGISKLSLVNATNKSAAVQVTIGGQTSSITLQDAASVVLQAAPGDLVTVKSDKAVSAALVIDLDSAVTVLPLTDYKNQASKVLVSVR